jgi:NAD(P)H-flavin reductase/hemoglobin-like flavoprotein
MTYFYGQLFAIDSEIRAMFPPAMDIQRKRFFQALTRIAAGQDHPDALTGYLSELGRAHRKYGVRERHYKVFRRALLATLRRFAAPGWNEAAQRAWETAFDHAAAIMIDAARRDAEGSPAWWTATVIGLEHRGPDIAVLTVAPEQPISYLPGQHVSVQTPRWPRLWRTYSIANAPRPDGLLRLHVQSVRGGLVSPVLVHQVQVGDPLVLGAPTGTMTADTRPTGETGKAGAGDASELREARDVLCLAGGTGLAPIKAIIEAIISTPAQGRPREIVLYYGARRHRDLYDVAALREMEQDYPGLQIILAVSDEPAHDVMHGAVMHGTVMSGAVPELAAKATFADRDVYISGPDQMIIKTVRALRERGAPDRLMHYDLSPEGGQAV